MKHKSIYIVVLFLISLALFSAFYIVKKVNPFHQIYLKITGKNSVEDILKKYEAKVEEKILPIFKAKNIEYPPNNLTLLAFKEERQLEVWTVSMGKSVFLVSYPFTTTSGTQGPKLNRGDGQIPEGYYKIESLNPNSAFHLSLKINYPNEFDLEKAKQENRMDPGDNIFIHGKDKSIGCIAIGDEAIEEIFVLAAKSPKSNLDVIIFPYDFRNYKYVYTCDSCPDWVNELYNRLKKTREEFLL